MKSIREVRPLFIILSQYWLLTKVVRRQIVFFPLLTLTIFFGPFLVTSTPPTMDVMRPAQVRCPGCERDFTPRGLSQHVTKTQDQRCRRVVATSQPHLLSAAFPRMASPPTLSSTWASQVAGEDALGGEYEEPTQGEFAVTHAACAAALQKNYRG